MNKSTVFGLVIVFILGAVGTYYYLQESGSTFDKNESDFAIEDTSAITKIYMADKKDREILLERKATGKWQVNNQYEVRKDVINTLLSTMKQVTVKAPVAKNAREKVIKNIASDGLKVEVYLNDEDKPNKIFYLGTADQFHSGTYMLLEGAENPYLMHIESAYGYLNPRFVMHEPDYRRNVIFAHRPEAIKNLFIDYPEYQEKSFSISQSENGEYIVRNANDVQVLNTDTAFLNSYLGRYKMINFESFEKTKDPQYLDSLVAKTPQFTIGLTDTNKITTTIKGFKKPVDGDFTNLFGDSIDYDMDRMYGLINNEEVVIIQYYVFDPLTVDVKEFESKEES
jgi:hypothetical protein